MSSVWFLPKFINYCSSQMEKAWHIKQKNSFDLEINIMFHQIDVEL